MTNPRIIAHIFILFLFFIHSEAGSPSLKKTVKKHLKGYEKNHPIKKWNKTLKSYQKILKKSKQKFYSNPNQGVKKITTSDIQALKNRDTEVISYKKSLEKLLPHLTTKGIQQDVFSQVPTATEEQKLKVLKYLQKGEASRLEKKEELLQKIKSTHFQFEKFETDWMFFFARHLLSEAVKIRFNDFHYNRNEKVFQKCKRVFQMYSKGIRYNPKRTTQKLIRLDSNMNLPLLQLNKLSQAISAKRIFSTVKTMAQNKGILFTAKAELKIKAFLEPLTRQNLNAVLHKRRQWLALQNELRKTVIEAKKEAERIAEGKAKRDAFQEKLASAIGQKSAKVNLDKKSKKALRKKSKKVKTTKLTSGRNKLEVVVDKFADSLARVDQKLLKLDSKHQKFSQLYGEAKENQGGIYSFVADGKSIDKKDLKSFVDEVSLISFGSSDDFLSYQPPKKWRLKKKIKWVAQKSSKEDTAQYKREFSYVDLFAEAHKTGVDNSQVTKKFKQYLPANLIIIFSPTGMVKRYQSFSNIHNLKIKKSDLEHGALYYKFLHYQIKRNIIQLHGIDHEIKFSKPR